MKNVPLIRQLEPWRTLVSILVGLGVAVGLPAAVVYVGGWPSPFESILVMAFVVYVAEVLLLRLLAARLLGHSREALQAINQGDYQRAILLYQQHLASLAKRPWLEKLRTVVFLDQSKIGWTEAAWVNLADCYIRLGILEKAVEYYRLCLSVHPDNVLALNGINMISLFTRQPALPEYDLEYRYAYDPGQRGPASWVPRVITYLLAIVCSCPFSVVTVFGGADAAITLGLPWIVFVVFALGFPPAYRWVAFRAFLPDLVRGLRNIRRGAYAEAAEAFQRQYDVLTEYPMIDRWRIVLLLEPGDYTYREWMLLYQVTPNVHLGRRNRVVGLYEECLKLNPDNVYARSGLELVRRLQAAAAPFGAGAAADRIE